MRLDDAVEEVAADEAEVAVDGREGALDEGPVLSVEVGDVGVRVVEVGDGDYRTRSALADNDLLKRRSPLPSQWCTQKYGTA